VVRALGDGIQVPALKLATELSKEGDHHGAAIEFRRLALGATAAAERGAYYWSASYEYWRGKNLEAMDQMLTRTEDEAPELRPMTLLLYAEEELAKRNWNAAASYSKPCWTAGDQRVEGARGPETRRCALEGEGCCRCA